MEELFEIRKEIDKVDIQLTKTFLERIELSKKVAEEKKSEGINVEDKSREEEIIGRLLENVPEETKGYVKKLYGTIFEVSKDVQEKVIGFEIKK